MRRSFVVVVAAAALVGTGLVGGGVAGAVATTCSGGATALSENFIGLGDFGHIPDASAACPAPGDPDAVVTETELAVPPIASLLRAQRVFNSTGASAVSEALLVVVPGVVGVEVPRAFASSTCAVDGTASQTLESSVVRLFNPTTGATIFSGAAPPNTTVIPGVLMLNRQSSAVAGNTAEGSVDAVVVFPGGDEIVIAHAKSDVVCALPITSVTVFGHAHENVDDPLTNEVEAIHIEVNGPVQDTNINDATPPTGKDFGAVIYEDSRQPPPGVAPETLKCRANDEDLTSLDATAPNVAVIEGSIRCFGITGLDVFTLTITDNGPNPPNGDGYSIEIRDATTGDVKYSRTGTTTVGGGDLTVITA